MNISPVPSVRANVQGNVSSISETPVNPGARAGGARRRSQPEGMPSPRGAARADSPNAEPEQVLGSGLPIELHAEVARHVLDVASNRDIASICRTAQAYDEAMPGPKKGHESDWRDWLNPTQRQILSRLKQRCNEAEAYVNNAKGVDCEDFDSVLACRLLPWISPEARSRLVRLLIAAAKHDGMNDSSEALHEIFHHHALLDEKVREELINWLNPVGSTGALTPEQQGALNGLLTPSSPGEPFCDYELAMRIGDFEQYLRHPTSDWPHWAFHLRPAARHEIIRSAFAQDPIRISGELIVLFSDIDEAQRDSLVSDLVSRGDQDAGMWLSSIAAQSGLLSQKAKEWMLGWTASGANQTDWVTFRRVQPLFFAQRRDAKFEESLVAHELIHGNTKQKLGALVHCCESLRGNLSEGSMRGLCEVFDKLEPAVIIGFTRRRDEQEDEAPIALWAGVGGALYTELTEPEKTRLKGRVEELARADSSAMSSALAGLASHLGQLDGDFVESLLRRVLEPHRATLEGYDIAQFYDGILPHFAGLEPEFQEGLREHMLSISIDDWVHSKKGSDVLLGALVDTARIGF